MFADNTPRDTADEGRRWRGLYATAGVGALLTALCIPLQIAIYIVAPPPTSHQVTDWLALFASNPVQGLLDLDLLMMVEQLLLVPVILALGILVYRRSASLTVLGLSLWLFGGVLFVASNTGFEMLSLARGYTAAATDPARASYVAAAQGMLASYFDMGTSFVFGYVLTAIGGVLVGAAMLRAHVLGRVAGWSLFIGNVIGVGIFIPEIGIAISLVSVVVLWVWYVVVGIGLVRLALASGDRVSTTLPVPTAASV